MTNPVVTVDDIENYLGRPLTDLEAQQVPVRLDGLVNSLELYWNRYLFPRDVNNEKHIQFGDGYIFPYHGPVQKVYSLSFGSGSASPTYTTDYNAYWDELMIVDGQVYFINYQAGDLSTADHMPAVKDLIIEAIVGGVIQGINVTAGKIGSYSVEGTSITYQIPNAQEWVGKVQVSDLTPLERLRRVVAR